MLDQGDVRLHYELAGAVDGPVLVLANSLGSNLHMWDKAFPSLEKSLRILRDDMRGHGKSSVPSPPYSTEQLGSDVLLLLARAIHSALRDSSYVELDSSHLSAWEKADAFAGAVLKLISPEQVDGAQ